MTSLPTEQAILSKEDYRSAIEEFDRLWAADPGGLFLARMDGLLRAIEDYERSVQGNSEVPKPRAAMAPDIRTGRRP